MKTLRPLFYPSLALLMIMGSSGTSSLTAEIFQFTDTDGVLHFTNVPTDPRYRRKGTGRPFSRYHSIQDLQQTILSAAGENNIDPDLIKAVIKVESNFDSGAVSRAGAMGLMQLMPATASRLQVHDPFDPNQNIWAGTRLLSDLVSRFGGDIRLGLAAYHAGESRVLEHGEIPPIPQTQRYVKKVMKTYARYREKTSGSLSDRITPSRLKGTHLNRSSTEVP